MSAFAQCEWTLTTHNFNSCVCFTSSCMIMINAQLSKCAASFTSMFARLWLRPTPPPVCYIQCGTFTVLDPQELWNTRWDSRRESPEAEVLFARRKRCLQSWTLMWICWNMRKDLLPWNTLQRRWKFLWWRNTPLPMEADSFKIAKREKTRRREFFGDFQWDIFAKRLQKIPQNHAPRDILLQIIWQSWLSVAISASVWMSCTQFLRLRPFSFSSCRSVTDLKAWLHQASMNDLERQCQHLYHILSIGVAIHFWRKLRGLLINLSNLFRAIMLTLSVNRP